MRWNASFFWTSPETIWSMKSQEWLWKWLNVTLNIYKSWINLLKKIVTEKTMAFQSVWYLWSRGLITWKSVCMKIQFFYHHSLLQTSWKQYVLLIQNFSVCTRIFWLLYILKSERLIFRAFSMINIGYYIVGLQRVANNGVYSTWRLWVMIQRQNKRHLYILTNALV